MELGYALSSEEHDPRALVRFACEAEQAGFEFALISDHFHPWIDRQGESPFVWSVLGGIAASTERLRVGTGVTCPTIRLHPAIVAQAAATAADMFDGRFFLGVGTGENLNEHILGDRWPPPDERRSMLEEAIAVIRELWNGDLTTFRGQHFRVENARIYTLPDAADRAARRGRRGRVRRARRQARGRLDRYLTGCRADRRVRTRRRLRQAALRSADRLLGKNRSRSTTNSVRVVAERGADGTARRRNSHYRVTSRRPHRWSTRMTSRQRSSAARTRNATPRRSTRIFDAGYTHVYIHQVGKDQRGFFDFYAQELLPRYARTAARTR